MRLEHLAAIAAIIVVIVTAFFLAEASAASYEKPAVRIFVR